MQETEMHTYIRKVVVHKFCVFAISFYILLIKHPKTKKENKSLMSFSVIVCDFIMLKQKEPKGLIQYRADYRVFIFLLVRHYRVFFIVFPTNPS